jgi:hypothetical protein
MLLIFLGIVALWYLLDPNRGGIEMFDPTGSEFVPAGALRHDLRGYPIKSRGTGHLYQSNNRNIMLSDSCGEKFSSNASPTGMEHSKVPCPKNGEYDQEDTCWRYNAPKTPKSGGCLTCPGAQSILNQHM